MPGLGQCQRSRGGGLITPKSSRGAGRIENQRCCWSPVSPRNEWPPPQSCSRRDCGNGGQHGVGGQKRFGIREDFSRDGFGGSIQRPAQGFRSGNAAGVAVFLRLRPNPEFFMRRRTGNDGLDEKVGVKMNHAESSGHQRLASRTAVIHSVALAASRRRCFCRDSKA